MKRGELWTLLTEQIHAAKVADVNTHYMDEEATLAVQMEVVGAIGKIIFAQAGAALGQSLGDLIDQMGGDINEALAQFVADFPIPPLTANE